MSVTHTASSQARKLFYKWKKSGLIMRDGLKSGVVLIIVSPVNISYWKV